MNIAFLGSGKVGGALAVRLARAGHNVTLAQSRGSSASIAVTLARDARLSARLAEDAVARSEIVFLATPFQASALVLPPLAERLAGKVLVDCTNPVGPGLTHALHSERSGSAFVQALVPEAKVVKAFTIYGFENLDDPPVRDHATAPVMLFCGDDADAKARVAPLIADVGFEPLDVGGLVQALHLEHMTLLWVRLVRLGGASPRLTWAALRR